MVTSPFDHTMLDSMANRGDDELDALVDRAVDQIDLRALLERLKSTPRLTHPLMKLWLDEKLLTTELFEFLNSDDRMPAWRNPELIRDGGEFYRDNGILALLMLGCASLPCCYSWEGVAQALGYSGRLEHDAPRRLPETAQMVMDVEDNLHMDPNDPGERKALQAGHKVRLMHSVLRHFIRKHEAPAANAPTRSDLADAMQAAHWSQPAVAPISQELLAGTLLTFHFVVLRGMRKLGLKITAHEERAYMHRWNVVGSFLGIDDVFLTNLNTFSDAQGLYDLIMERNRRPTREGPLLEAALLGYMRNNIIKGVTGGRLHPAQHVPAIVTWWVSDRATSEVLKIKLYVAERILMPFVVGFFWLINTCARVRVFRFISRAFFRWLATNAWRLRAEPGDKADATRADSGVSSDRTGHIIVPDSLAREWRM